LSGLPTVEELKNEPSSGSKYASSISPSRRRALFNLAEAHVISKAISTKI
jgi:hypothetical protein